MRNFFSILATLLNLILFDLLLIGMVFYALWILCLDDRLGARLDEDYIFIRVIIIIFELRSLLKGHKNFILSVTLNLSGKRDVKVLPPIVTRALKFEPLKTMC